MTANLLKRHSFTPRQKQVMRGMINKPEIWCDGTQLTGSLKATYFALLECGAIRAESGRYFVLTSWGKEVVGSFKK
jgi:hypothetical protein